MSTSVPIEEHLRALEEQLLQRDVRTSASRLDVLLADEFIEFGSSGRIFDKQDLIESLRAESPTHRSLTEFTARILAPGVVLATYRAVRHGPSNEAPVRSLRSSVWKLTHGQWRMVFHQGTLSE